MGRISGAIYFKSGIKKRLQPFAGVVTSYIISQLQETLLIFAAVLGRILCSGTIPGRIFARVNGAWRLFGCGSSVPYRAGVRHHHITVGRYGAGTIRAGILSVAAGSHKKHPGKGARYQKAGQIHFFHNNGFPRVVKY